MRSRKTRYSPKTDDGVWRSFHPSPQNPEVRSHNHFLNVSARLRREKWPFSQRTFFDQWHGPWRYGEWRSVSPSGLLPKEKLQSCVKTPSAPASSHDHPSLSSRLSEPRGDAEGRQGLSETAAGEKLTARAVVFSF